MTSRPPTARERRNRRVALVVAAAMILGVAAPALTILLSAL
ncbi:MAG: hypothetical protein ACTMIR_06335 [Cellulomonadaceae bacterium]